MTDEDRYIYGRIAAHQPLYSLQVAEAIKEELRPIVVEWSNGHLHGIYVAGSLAKDTGISGTTDIDILVSLKHTATSNLRDVYETLFSQLSSRQLNPRRQNVSIGLSAGDNNQIKVDVVPARKHREQGNDHSLWSHKHSTWRQTNIHDHVRLVASSGRTDVIKAMKIWRKCNNLEFPSFLLEMTVLTALSGNRNPSIAESFVTVLKYIRDELPAATIYDPANSNNKVTEDMTPAEKQKLSVAAALSLDSTWRQVIW